MKRVLRSLVSLPATRKKHLTWTIDETVPRGRPTAYALAIAVTAITIVVRHSLDASWGSARPFVLFFPAIMIAGRVEGFGPGVASTIVSSLAIDFLWLGPVGSFHLIHSKNVESFVIFFLSGILISALNGSLHNAIRRAETLHTARETLLAIVML